MASPEAPARQDLTPELRDRIARRVAEKAFKKADGTMPSTEMTVAPRVFQHIPKESITPNYVSLDPEKYTETDFSKIRESALLSPISRDPSNITTIISYILMINDGAPLTAIQYGQLQNRLLEMQTKGLIGRTPVGLYRILKTE
jgi:hypothetical protein